jgi:hypothetical protein
MRRHVKAGALPGWTIVRRPVPATGTLTTEAGDDLLTESGAEIKKET